MRIESIALTLLLVGCSQMETRIPISPANLAGEWSNKRSSAFIGSGWDQCAFYKSGSFECKNYPLEGDLVLTYVGVWELNSGVLQITAENEVHKFKIETISENKFKLYSSDNEAHLYKRTKF